MLTLNVLSGLNSFVFLESLLTLFVCCNSSSRTPVRFTFDAQHVAVAAPAAELLFYRLKVLSTSPWLSHVNGSDW